VQSLYNLTTFIINPGYGISIFTSSPRNIVSLIVLSIFVLRYVKEIKLSYLFIFIGIGIHFFSGIIVLINFIFLDLLNKFVFKKKINFLTYFSLLYFLSFFIFFYIFNFINDSSNLNHYFINRFNARYLGLFYVPLLFLFFYYLLKLKIMANAVNYFNIIIHNKSFIKIFIALFIIFSVSMEYLTFLKCKKTLKNLEKSEEVYIIDSESSYYYLKSMHYITNFKSSNSK